MSSLASGYHWKLVEVYLQHAAEFGDEHHIALGLELSAHEGLPSIKLSYERPSSASVSTNGGKHRKASRGWLFPQPKPGTLHRSL